MGQDAFLNRIVNFKRLLLDTNAIIYFLQGISPYDSILNPLFHLFEAGTCVEKVERVEKEAVAVERESDILLKLRYLGCSASAKARFLTVFQTTYLL